MTNHRRDPEQIRALADDLLDWLAQRRCRHGDAVEAAAIAIAALVNSMADGPADAKLGGNIAADMLKGYVRDMAKRRTH
jgi:plasmid stability protein